ncbi:MAG TPA: cytochrome c biogenesis protein CcsA [Candidatus Thermoplasmatota archaeon]
MGPSRSLDRILLVAALGGGAILVWLALVAAPSFEGRIGFTAPISWKLFFFHVPVALVSFIAFAVALVASLQYLRLRRLEWDRSAHAAIEVGVVYTAITLVTGMLWGQAEWGTMWRWNDVKLVLVLILFLIYVAYLVLRREIQDPERRARISALYAVAGFASVPLAWFAQRIWLSYHPTVFGTEAADQGVLTEGVFPIFLLGLAVFVTLFLFLYRWREKLLAAEARLDEVSVAKEVA